MKDLIIYSICIQKGQGTYHEISSFLSKLYTKEKFDMKDVIHIKSYSVNSSKFASRPSFINFIYEQNELFEEIKGSENIYEGIENRKDVIVAVIDCKEIEDISELLPLILIKQYFININFFILLKGEQKDYFKISHYLYTISQDTIFYESIYFKQNGANHPQRLQVNSVGRLTHFLPMQLLDANEIKKYMQDLSFYVSYDWLINLLNDQCD